MISFKYFTTENILRQNKQNINLWNTIQQLSQMISIL